ncbi:MAG TPA: right-handed parallel beta-helix repeat-containing protein [Candidatus Angelobacter sp.]|nr:right-handed parallel beta-helix repeat-containing protein [Candidatus Angelobacter sp.]
MRKINVSAIFAVVLLGATLMTAQATRTWVSGVGDDANPCSRTAPCKTWAGAISKTAPGGEIDALDPGGFGALTITKSITLDGGGGQVASVLVAGTNGITVAAGANDVVILRNLRLDGLLGNGTNSGNAGLSGISFISGKDLNIENCVIFGFNTAGITATLSATATLHVVNTIIKNIGSCNPASCTTGQGDGIFASTSSGTLKVSVDDSHIMVLANNGIEAGANSRIVVEHSTVSAAGASGIVAGATQAQVTVSFSNVNYNVSGISSLNGGGANVAFTNVAYNSACSLNNAAGSNGFATFGNNRLVGPGATACIAGGAITTAAQF